MPRPRSTFARKRKFNGNQFTETPPCPVNVTPHKQTVETSEVQSSDKKDSASKKKCKYIDLCDAGVLGENLETGNIIMDLSALNRLLQSAVSCKFCDGGRVCAVEIVPNRRGLASCIRFSCDNCEKTTDGYSSLYSAKKKFEENLRFVYAMRSVGRGLQSSQSFCAAMNLPPPPGKFEKYNEILKEFCKDAAQDSMREAAKEAAGLQAEVDRDISGVKAYDIELEEAKIRDIAIGLDGSWQKRGHQSLNGVVTATSFDSGKVSDVQCLTKFCIPCARSKDKECSNPGCSKHYVGSSGGMEVNGASIIINRSLEEYHLRYTTYLGDGDSKGFQTVVESKPYGDEVSISKLECVGHVQKRMGTRLRKLLRETKLDKLDDGKKLGGLNRLTHNKVDQLQGYYGKAIRSNENDLAAMKKAVWATFFHKLSTDENPQHSMCPAHTAQDPWCKYQNAKVTGEVYTHKNALPEAIMNKIKPIYRDLANEKLLKKCLHGRTQNANESFNNVVCCRVPKNVLIGLNTFQLGVYDAVLTFNDGQHGRLKVLMKITGSDTGKNSVFGFRIADQARVKKAEKAEEAVQKKRRRAKRSARRSLQDDEEYKAGGF